MADINAQQKKLARAMRHRRVRAKVSGTADRPRLSVYRSLTGIYGQIIDDAAGKTLAAVGKHDLKAAGASKTPSKVEGKKPGKSEGGRKGKTAEAFALGKLLAERAKAAGVTAVVFDRGGFAFKGRIAAFAEGARENGLVF